MRGQKAHRHALGQSAAQNRTQNPKRVGTGQIKTCTKRGNFVKAVQPPIADIEHAEHLFQANGRACQLMRQKIGHAGQLAVRIENVRAERFGHKRHNVVHCHAGLVTEAAAFLGDQLQRIDQRIGLAQRVHHADIDRIVARQDLNGQGDRHAAFLCGLHHFVQPVFCVLRTCGFVFKDRFHRGNAVILAVMNTACGQRIVFGNRMHLSVEEMSRMIVGIGGIGFVPLTGIAVERDGIVPHPRKGTDIFLRIGKRIGGNIHREVDVLTNAAQTELRHHGLVYGKECIKVKSMRDTVAVCLKQNARICQRFTHAAQHGGGISAANRHLFAVTGNGIMMRRHCSVNFQCHRSVGA